MKTMTKAHKNGHDGIQEPFASAEQITDAVKEAKSSAAKALKDARAYCRENPGTAMGIAAAAAALVSLSLVKALGRKESAGEKFVSELFRKGEKAWEEIKRRGEPAVHKIKETVGA